MRKKKLYLMSRLIVCLCAVLSSTTAFAAAGWIGNSYINVNEKWYQAHGTESWALGGVFNGHDFGSISSLAIGGQLQIGDNGADWKSGAGDWMHYKIDNGDPVDLNIAYKDYGHGEYSNNMKFQTGGSNFSTSSIDISSFSDGTTHTLTVWFGDIDGVYENGQSSATYYTATFKKATDISTAVVAGVDDVYDWTGSIIHPVPVVTVSGTTLTSSDYDVTYSEGCTNGGNYSVTINGKGNYIGTKVVNFTINPGYFVAGIGGVWNINRNYQLLRTDELNKTEYWINDLVMSDGDAIKVVSSDDGSTINNYYGGNENYKINANGSYKIYFRPGQNSDWSNNGSGGYFYVEKLTSTKVTLAPAGYATYYNSANDVTLPEGVVAYILTSVAGTEPTYIKIADAGESVAAATAMLLYSADVKDNNQATEITLTLSAPSQSTPRRDDGNLLHGSDIKTTTTGGAKYYKLTYGSASGHESVFGWYYGEDDGAAFTSPAHKAWLALPATNARAFLSLPGDEATGIATIENKHQNADNVWYDLNGRRINAPMTKGIYVKDGRKMVIK